MLKICDKMTPGHTSAMPLGVWLLPAAAPKVTEVVIRVREVVLCQYLNTVSFMVLFGIPIIIFP